ncbi:GNAT family N-acetyltransferase [Risungbinella massiliensis]|uniref:GNAT family N-acetyltransferase n=1 Tax=Risungbinella massiliensis TaxID=1329796 RepID=UPI0005CB9752|nr:GNAT family N-acetyltransferase [Risungbinella massiliensis]
MVDITLQPVTRDNWEKVLVLKMKEEQKGFVTPVAVSLAKVSIKPDGDNVTYLPFAIYHHDQIVGFVMHAYEEDSHNMYWIDGFFIDEKYQGRGYGKAAFSKIVNYIQTCFKQCKEIRLVVKPDNLIAKQLYRSFGFVDSEEFYGKEGHVYRYSIE